MEDYVILFLSQLDIVSELIDKNSYILINDLKCIKIQLMQGEKELKYKVVQIQKLKDRPQIETKKVTDKEIIEAMNWQYTWFNKPVLLYKDTGIGNQRVMTKNGVFRVNSFFDAFLHAYKQHGDVALVPDEVWIMVSFYLSTYIDKNAEKLRSKLVEHEGSKVLTIYQQVQSKEHSLQQEKNWDYFFDQIVKAIQKQTKAGIVESLSCNFSTTNKTYKVISTAIIMNSLQKFFQYHREFCICGINNVYMAGVREDWAKMIPKLEEMVQFDVDGELKKYIQHMKVILQNFLLTFDEKPNIQWWNTVMKSYEKKQVYGGQATDIDGWILHFFGIYEKTDLYGFPEMMIKVPIQLINNATGIEKQLLLVSDWCSVSKVNKRTYKPDVGVCIFVKKEYPIGKKPKQQGQEEEH